MKDKITGDLFATTTPAPTAPLAVVDQELGVERGVAGAQAALDHADGASTVRLSAWSDDAWAFTRRWVRSILTAGEFALEDVRVAFEAEHPTPPNNNAWGAIGRRLVREKVAVRTGNYRTAKIASSNGRAVALYRRAAA